MMIRVKIEVELEHIKQLTKNNEAPINTLELMVSKGMRAQLKIGNLITGSMYVALDFFKTASPASIIMHDDIIEIPTIPASLDELTDKLTTLLNKLSNIPIEKIGSAALDTIHSIEETSRSFKKTGDSITDLVSSDSLKKAVNSLNLSLEQIQRLTFELEQTLPPAVNSVSKKTITALGQIENLTAPDSAIILELNRTLREFSKTAQTIRKLADYLERHPESIIQGKGKE